MKIANITIGFLFLLFGWWLTSVELPSKPHSHSVEGVSCIGNGMKCVDFIYCENRNMRVVGMDRHRPVTKQDSLQFKLSDNSK